MWRGSRALTLLDVVVAVAVLTVLVYLVRLDWRRPEVGAGSRDVPAGRRTP